MPKVAVGERVEVEVAGRRLTFVNPGVRAVLRAQEECVLPNGQLSVLRYVEHICARWVEPRITMDWFTTEDEVVEFLRAWNDFRRPDTVSAIRAEPPAVSLGQAATVFLDEERQIRVVNPGLKWVLEAQEACTLPNGQFSWLRYTERLMRDCVVGSPKIDDMFVHEDEVLEFLRIFRLLRERPGAAAAAGTGVAGAATGSPAGAN